MRISTSWMQQRALNDILNRQVSLSDTQQRLASGKRLINAADDPVAAAQTLKLKHVDAANEQYMRNIGTATNRLGLAESRLEQVVGILQRARTLALAATNASHTVPDRQAAATELEQLFTSIVQIANATDAEGDALFAGNAVRTVPFVAGAGTQVTYHGDDGQRMVAAAPGMQVAVSDPGSNVFMDIPAGNGRFAVTADPANSGAVIVGKNSVVDTGSYAPGHWSIAFDGAGGWQATDVASGTVVATGTYDGQGAIAFGGMQIEVSGPAAAGDTLDVRSGATQSAFASLGQLVDALRNMEPGAASTNLVNRQIEGIDQSLERVLDVQARLGARFNVLEQQLGTSGDLKVLNKQVISQLEDLDIASAISQLNLQTTALEAAQKTYVKIQGMSLFDYLR